jgi:rare lipoprotein A
MKMKLVSCLLRVSLVSLIMLMLTARMSSAQYRPVQKGIASYYSNSFNGQLTSTGDVFTNKGMTAASNALPLGTMVKVTNLRNHKWVIVTINDRMSRYNKRTIDLTKAAAKRLGMVYHGLARVKVEVLPVYYRFFHPMPDGLMAFGESDVNSGS